MFIGNHSHLLDGKGRISIPAKFRDVLAQSRESSLVLSPDVGRPGTGRYLVARTRKGFEEFLAAVQSQAEYDFDLQDFERLVIGQAEESEIDGQGRILIPPRLKTKAGLSKRVVFAGVGDRFQIWDEEAWEKVIAQIEERVATNPGVMPRPWRQARERS